MLIKSCVELFWARCQQCCSGKRHASGIMMHENGIRSQSMVLRVDSARARALFWLSEFGVVFISPVSGFRTLRFIYICLFKPRTFISAPGSKPAVQTQELYQLHFQIFRAKRSKSATDIIHFDMDFIHSDIG